MDAKTLAQYALLVLRQIEKLPPLDRQGILHVAYQINQVHIAETERPPKDERQ